MPTLTKENAPHHCRTCLKKLGFHDNEREMPPSDGEEFQEIKDISININTNVQLQQLLAKYVDEQVRKAGIELVNELPKKLCLSCYNKLDSFDKFQRRAVQSAQKLNSVLNSRNGVHKVEFEETYEEQAIPTTARQDDIYKLLLKDSLMETESVLLNATGSPLPNVEVADPDPFAVEVLPKAKSNQEEFTTTTDERDEDEGAEGAFDWEQHTDTDDSVDSESEISVREQKQISEKMEGTRRSRKNALAENDESSQSCMRATRSRARLKSEYAGAPPQSEKKKRRTKKEMEEWRKMQSEKLELKMKRRNKGTRNTFKCSQCNHCFAHNITLDAHVRKVHEGLKRPFKCDRCDKSYTFIGGLYTHIKEIHEPEVRSYTCDHPGCDRIYTSFIAMQKHKRMKHTENNTQKKYVCEQCGSTFNQSCNLKYHRRTKHPTEAEQAEKEQSKERFECLLCKKFFHSRYTLKYHTLQLHSNAQKYECNVCGRRMAKKFMLVQHMLVHSKDKMPCEHCGKQFIRKFELEAHIRAVHMKLKPFECQYCSECFASRKTLRHHEYIHTGEKPYVCDICGQAYRQQTCLKNHRKSHEKMNAQALLAANLNHTLMNSLLGPQQQIPNAATDKTDDNSEGTMNTPGITTLQSAVQQ